MVTKFYTALENFSQAGSGQHVHYQNIKSGEESAGDPRAHQERRNEFLVPVGMAYPDRGWLYLCGCSPGDSPRSRIEFKK